MRHCLLLTAALTIAVAAAPCALGATATVLAFEASIGKLGPGGDGSGGAEITEVRPIEPYTVWLGPGRARIDTGLKTAILRLDLGQLIQIDHRSRTYEVMTWPIVLEQYIPDEETRKAFQETVDELEPRTGLAKGEEGQVGPWQARHFEFTVEIGGGWDIREIFDIWSAELSGVDVGLYKELLRSTGRLQLSDRSWIDKMLTIEGFPILLERRDQQRGHIGRVFRRRLVSVQDVDVPADHFDPPVGYSSVAVRFSRYFSVTKPSAEVPIP